MTSENLEQLGDTQNKLYWIQQAIDHIDQRKDAYQFSVFENVEVVERGNRRFEIDMVIVGANKILIVEVKNILGIVQANDKDWYVMRNGKQHLVRNPLWSLAHRQRVLYSKLKERISSKKLPGNIEGILLLTNVKEEDFTNNQSSNRYSQYRNLKLLFGLKELESYLNELSSKERDPESDTLLTNTLVELTGKNPTIFPLNKSETQTFTITIELNQVYQDFTQVRVSKESGFSFRTLTQTLGPYLLSIEQLQHVIDKLNGRSPTDIRILAIRYGSISVDVTGGIRDTIELILNNIVPWRREHYKKMKELEVTQKGVEIKQKEVEIEQIKASVESEMIQANDKARLVQAQAQKQELENQKMQLEIIKLALEVAKQVRPNIPEEQHMLYAMRMLGPVDLLAKSPLEIVDLKTIGDDGG